MNIRKQTSKHTGSKRPQWPESSETNEWGETGATWSESSEAGATWSEYSETCECRKASPQDTNHLTCPKVRIVQVPGLARCLQAAQVVWLARCLQATWVVWLVRFVWTVRFVRWVRYLRTAWFTQLVRWIWTTRVIRPFQFIRPAQQCRTWQKRCLIILLTPSPPHVHPQKRFATHYTYIQNKQSTPHNHQRKLTNKSYILTLPRIYRYSKKAPDRRKTSGPNGILYNMYRTNQYDKTNDSSKTNIICPASEISETHHHRLKTSFPFLLQFRGNIPHTSIF